LVFFIVVDPYLSSSDRARSIFKKQHMRHFSGLFTSLWKRRYDKRMDLALNCLGKDVTPEKLEQKGKDVLHKISFYFLRNQIQPDWSWF
jgi:hypothetical protein